MTDATVVREPDSSLVTTLHVTYALHAVGLAIGAFGAVDRGRRVHLRLAVDHRGDHQLREARRRARHVARVALRLADPDVLVSPWLWSCLIAVDRRCCSRSSLVGFAIWAIGFFVLGIWAIYRIARAGSRLNDRRPVG